MKIKSILSLTLAAAFLAGCASTEKQMVDGKEREVFVGAAGSWAKDGETLDSFNAISRPCQQSAMVDVDQSRKHLDTLIPFNVPANKRHLDAVLEATEVCLKAAGFTLVKRSKAHTSMQASSK